MRRTLAYHVIVSMYGFWLPNDPRGSGSDFIGAWELFRYGGCATKVDTIGPWRVTVTTEGAGSRQSCTSSFPRSS
jgi:hypothetical protein